jgi:hypothetical protein
MKILTSKAMLAIRYPNSIQISSIGNERDSS